MIGQLLGDLYGSLTAKRNDRRQLKQQKKLMAAETQNNMKLAKFNQELAMKQWEDTNYAAQTDQLKKAGLNTGLMYAMGGPGGSTMGAGEAGMVDGGKAPAGGGEYGMGAQLGMQMELLKAQKENIQADTENKKANTVKTSGVDTELGKGKIEEINTSIEAMKVATNNEKLKGMIMEYEKTMKGVEANIATATAEDLIKQVSEATQKLIAEVQSAKVKADIDQKTQDAIIENANKVNEKLDADIKATKTGTEKTEQEIKNLSEDEITKKLQNGMREAGINEGDSTLVRMGAQAIKNAGGSISSMAKKTAIVIQWLKGERGAQTMDNLKEQLSGN